MYGLLLFYSTLILLYIVDLSVKLRFPSKYINTYTVTHRIWLSVGSRGSRKFHVLNQTFNTCSLHFKFSLFVWHIFHEYSGHISAVMVRALIRTGVNNNKNLWKGIMRLNGIGVFNDKVFSILVYVTMVPAISILCLSLYMPWGRPNIRLITTHLQLISFF